MNTPIVNALKDGLARGEFLVTLEYCLGPCGESLDALWEMARYAADERQVHAIALTDRVTSEKDYEPIEVAVEVMRRSGKVPLVHVSGKDRTADEVERRLRRLADAGLENVLAVTGDMPRPKKKGDVVIPANGYVDSVQTLHLARQASASSLLAAGVSTFKYTEPELMGQLIKMHKKIAQGAQLIFNQVGYDLRKTQELTRYIQHTGETIHAMAALYWLTPGFARFALAGNVPGVVVTEDLCRRIEEICKEPDAGRWRRTDLLAIHILLCKQFGYRGVHVGGLKKPETIHRILQHVDRLDRANNDIENLWAWWCEHFQFNNGLLAELGRPGAFYLFEPDDYGLNRPDYAPPAGDDRISPKYYVLRKIHDIFFEKGLRPGGTGERLVRKLASLPIVREAGYTFERAVKSPLVGCQGCGSCSLPDTEYVCIEASCAKGLPNGPCGGTQFDGRCEVHPDRECAWVEIYRRAKSQGNLALLQNRFVQAKDRALRHTCSWINLAIGIDHHAEERTIQRGKTEKRKSEIVEDARL